MSSLVYPNQPVDTKWAYIFGELEANSYRPTNLCEQAKILSTPHANIFVETIVSLVLTMLDWLEGVIKAEQQVKVNFTFDSVFSFTTKGCPRSHRPFRVFVKKQAQVASLHLWKQMGHQKLYWSPPRKPGQGSCSCHVFSNWHGLNQKCGLNMCHLCSCQYAKGVCRLHWLD